jgi:hypothetical protein
VLDTNVLLSHLKFVTELKDFPIPGRLVNTCLWESKQGLTVALERENIFCMHDIITLQLFPQASPL